MLRALFYYLFLISGLQFATPIPKKENPMTLTKQQIVEAIAESNGYPKSQSYEILETLLEIIKSTLESGEDVLVSGFGKFCVNEKKARKGRNPATGEDMMLAPRRVVTFKCSGRLRDGINQEEIGLVHQHKSVVNVIK
jgi:integration host factor subunit alpha